MNYCQIIPKTPTNDSGARKVRWSNLLLCVHQKPWPIDQGGAHLRLSKVEILVISGITLCCGKSTWWPDGQRERERERERERRPRSAQRRTWVFIPARREFYCPQWVPSSVRTSNAAVQSRRGEIILVYGRISITWKSHDGILETGFDLLSPASEGWERGSEAEEDRKNDRDPRSRGSRYLLRRLRCSFPADIKDRSAWYVRLLSGSRNFHIFTSTTDRTLRLYASVLSLCVRVNDRFRKTVERHENFIYRRAKRCTNYAAFAI